MYTYDCVLFYARRGLLQIDKRLRSVEYNLSIDQHSCKDKDRTKKKRKRQRERER